MCDTQARKINGGPQLEQKTALQLGNLDGLAKAIGRRRHVLVRGFLKQDPALDAVKLGQVPRRAAVGRHKSTIHDVTRLTKLPATGERFREHAFVLRVNGMPADAMRGGKRIPDACQAVLEVTMLDHQPGLEKLPLDPPDAGIRARPQVHKTLDAPGGVGEIPRQEADTAEAET